MKNPKQRRLTGWSTSRFNDDRRMARLRARLRRLKPEIPTPPRVAR